MPHPPAPRAVVFDLDGLMIDSESLFERVAAEMLARRGLPGLAPEVLRHMLGRPAAVGFAYFREFYGLADIPANLTDECRAMIFAALDVGAVPLMPGVTDLLDALGSHGLPAAIATSSGRSYLERVLAPHGVLPRFRFALTREDVTRCKPDPEVYRMAAARLGVAPGETVVLEDSLNGLIAAKAAGARCVVVPHAAIEREALGAADAVLSSLAATELYELLGLR